MVRLGDLQFRNETERAALTRFDANRSDPDYIDLFLASFENSGEPNSIRIHQRISSYVEAVKKEIDGKPEPKKVKYIYEDVHRVFFRSYKLQNSFTDIFDKGEYNCVSASALYAIIFKMLEIPFQVMESPQHVYLVTYPQTHKILIETTSPGKGYFEFTSGFIEKYVKSLCESKVIPKSELEASGAAAVFNKYYFSKSGVSMLQLAGFQYSNFAVYAMQDNRSDKALPEMKRSYFLSPSERNRSILKMALIQFIDDNKYETQEQVEAFGLL